MAVVEEVPVLPGVVQDKILPLTEALQAMEAMACLTDLERGEINDKSMCMARLVLGAINIYASATDLSIPSCLNLLSMHGLNERARGLADLILERLDAP